MPEYFRADSVFVIDCFNPFNFFFIACVIGHGGFDWEYLKRGSKISDRFALKTATVALVMQLLYIEEDAIFLLCASQPHLFLKGI